MRMGRLNSRERHLRKPPPKLFAKKSSAGLMVGSVSSNLLASIYTPAFIQVANQELEDYAHELLEYEDRVKRVGLEATEEIERDVADESIKRDGDGPPRPPLFSSQFMVDEFSDMITDTSKYFSAPKNEWKIHLNAAKFERQLDEKYGILRPFIANHPEIELFLKSMQRKYATGHFSPFRQGDPPIPRTTAIVILFMMQRNSVRWEILTLGALFFLIGLQPWALVLIVALVTHEFSKRKKKLVGSMKPRREPVRPYYHNGDVVGTSLEKLKEEFLHRPVGTKFAKDEAIDMSGYDTIILGSGPSTLYTASLLARAGRSVLVLSPIDDASGCLTFESLPNPALAKKYLSIPFDVETSNVSRISRQQGIMAPALCTSTDYQGGIRFAQIGTAADGFAFEILSIPGMGAERSTDEIPFVLRASGGKQSLMDDAATYLGDGWPANDGNNGNSLTGSYVDVCTGMNVSSAEFYRSKVLSDNANGWKSKSTYQETSIRYTSSFLNKCFPFNAHLRSLMAGIGMKGENIRPNNTSMGAHVTNLCAALSGEGMHYPIGGPRALCHALAAAVEQSGGKIVSGVAVKELLFQMEGDTSSDSVEQADAECPHCVGVKLEGGTELFLRDGPGVHPAVVSMHGFIDTFIRLLPEKIRSSHKVPRGLPALSEQRPVFKVLFGLSGSPEELSVTGADFYRLPGAALSVDEIDPETGVASLGEIGWETGGAIASPTTDKRGNTQTVTSESVESDTIGGSTSSRAHKSGRFKFDPKFSWLKISFPSAKDPSFPLRHGFDVTTCVVTIEADDDFVLSFDTKPKLFGILKDKSSDSDLRQRLLDRVTVALLGAFPQLEGKVEHAEVRGPFYKGLSHTPERFAAKGIRVDTPYPRLFMGGPDLTVGDSFAGSIVAGWLAANAVVGYSTIDYLLLKKTITTDLERFMTLPELSDDLAVPCAASLSKDVRLEHEVHNEIDPHEKKQQ